MEKEIRKILADHPITWFGDLDDDCSAKWAGLLLRAEWMDEQWWWWAVYDMENNEEQIDSSNEHEEEEYNSGQAAREAAEIVARKYMETLLK